MNFKASTPSTPGGRCECHGCVLPPGWSGISASCDYFGLKILVNPFSKVDFHRLNFGSHNGTCLWDSLGEEDFYFDLGESEWQPFFQAPFKIFQVGKT